MTNEELLKRGKEILGTLASRLNKTLVITVCDKEFQRSTISTMHRRKPTKLKTSNLNVLRYTADLGYPLFRNIKSDMFSDESYDALCQIFKNNITKNANGRREINWDAIAGSIIEKIKEKMAINAFHMKANAPSTIKIKDGTYHLGTTPMIATRQLMSALIWRVEK